MPYEPSSILRFIDRSSIIIVNKIMEIRENKRCETRNRLGKQQNYIYLHSDSRAIDSNRWVCGDRGNWRNANGLPHHI